MIRINFPYRGSLTSDAGGDCASFPLAVDPPGTLENLGGPPEQRRTEGNCEVGVRFGESDRPDRGQKRGHNRFLKQTKGNKQKAGLGENFFPSVATEPALA